MSHEGRPGPESAESSHSALRSTSESEHASTLESSGVSGLLPFSPGTLEAPESGRAEPATTDERFRVLKELELAVDSFRKGEVPKTAALSSVIRILGENSHVTAAGPQKEATFDSYLTEILSIDSTRGDEGRPARTTEEVHPTSDRAGTKRGSGKNGDAAESESDDDDDKPTKKQKLLESDLPSSWFAAPKKSSSDPSSPSSQETCRLLRIYNIDITKAKFFIKIAPNSPAGIPSSQWERILKGDAVDLNQIFASLHHTIPDEERTGRLGDTEISFGVVEAKKRISTSAEWSASWRRASRAIEFAFPHRREELLEYGDYMESEFTAKLVSSHPKLLLYDIALRNEVAAGQRILLTDHSRFTRLYSAIVLPDGVEGGSTKSSNDKPSGARQPNGKPEICNKFNAGTCKNADGDCKYRHICKKCKKPGHGDKDCPTGGK
jgi:hypothetical protein